MKKGIESTVRGALRIAFVGTAISEKLCEQEPACSSAGNKFQLSLIMGLEKALGQSLHVISVWPVSMYPRSRMIFSPCQTCQVGTLTTARLVPFLNLPVLKQVSMMLSIFSHLVVWLWRERKSDKRVVLVYNVFTPFSLAVLGATALLGGRPVAVVADLPHDIYDFKGGICGLLQRIDFFIQTHVIKRFAALIPLTHHIAQDFAPGRSALVVEGGIDKVEVKQIGRHSIQSTSALPIVEKIILYSGALNDLNGIDLLIQAFQFLSESEFCLHIFGRGPLEPLVREAAAQDKRIFYGGVLPNAEIKLRQAQATCLVNPRPSYRKVTHYTFPSKLLEYLVSGCPTITTALPGIPEEYYPYVYLLRDETPEGLAQIIQDVCSKDPAELEQFGQRAREFVLHNKNWTLQGQRIYEYICSL